MADPQRRCWDSVCCLGWLRNEPDKAPACQAVLDLVDAGKVELVVSTLALAEVLWIRGHDRIPRDSKEKVRAFFRRSSFLVASVDLATAELAQELVWDYGVKSKDAVHVATALLLGCVSLDNVRSRLMETGREARRRAETADWYTGGWAANDLAPKYLAGFLSSPPSCAGCLLGNLSAPLCGQPSSPRLTPLKAPEPTERHGGGILPVCC